MTRNGPKVNDDWDDCRSCLELLLRLACWPPGGYDSQQPMNLPSHGSTTVEGRLATTRRVLVASKTGRPSITGAFTLPGVQEKWGYVPAVQSRAAPWTAAARRRF